MEFKKISNHNIQIRHTVNGGCIVKVGCAELSFSSPEDMMDVMKQFYEDPEGMEKEYNRTAGPNVTSDVTDGDAEEARPNDEDRGEPSGNTVRNVSAGRPVGRGPIAHSDNVEESAPDRRR